MTWQGVNPLTYFDNNDNALQSMQDAYNAMNLLRPREQNWFSKEK